MSLPNSNRNEMDAFDLSMQRRMQKWVDGKQPPRDTKARLLQRASQANKPASVKANRFSIWFLMGLDDCYSEIYLERFRIRDIYFPQPGALGLVLRYT
jgi:hypothetical protein